MLPKVNQILFMRVNSIDEEESNREYKSRVADVQDNYMTIEVPIHVKDGKIKRLYPGDEINVYFITEVGVRNYFNTSVLGYKEDVIRLIVIKKPDPKSITKVQRRSFLRVPAELEVAVKLTEQVKFLGRTEDVGGGGVSFVCDGFVPIEVRDVVSCWLLIHYKNGSIEHANFKGELVRIKPLESGEKLAMLQFTEISDNERQKVIRYCFERQLDFRKK